VWKNYLEVSNAFPFKVRLEMVVKDCLLTCIEIRPFDIVQDPEESVTEMVFVAGATFPVPSSLK
jgi:hypothetical protein